MSGRRIFVPCRDALDYCARAMDDLSGEDEAREDVRAIFLVAGQIEAACKVASASIQVDDRMPVPQWLFRRYGAGEE